MDAKYFVYDDISLKTMGYVICTFDSSSSNSATDSQKSFNTVSIENGKYKKFITATYDSPLQMYFGIMRDPCFTDETEIGEQEMATLKRWLNRPTPHVLQINGTGLHNIYWEGSFNVNEEIYEGRRVGANLTFTCNAPFGYKKFHDIEWQSGGDPLTVTDISDEIGYIYPTLKITCNAGGEFILSDQTGRVTRIQNCVSGETITILPNLQITTDSDVHKKTIYDDFNYVFPIVQNSFKSQDNVYTSSGIACSIVFNYKPIAKAVVL